MEYIASYPLTEDILTPHIGRTVYGVTHLGDRFYGVLKECKDGHLFLSPIQETALIRSAGIRAATRKLVRQTKSKQHQGKTKTLPRHSRRSMDKAKISVFYPGFGFGFGAGLGFILPLLAIGALFLI